MGDLYLVSVPTDTMDKLAALRRPGESYSDVIIRLAAGERGLVAVWRAPTAFWQVGARPNSGRSPKVRRNGRGFGIGPLQPMTTRIAITADAYAAIRESLPPAGSRPPQEVGDLYLVSVPTDTMDKLADPAQAGRELQRRDHRDGGGGTRLTTQSQSARVALSAGPPLLPQTNLKSRATRFVIRDPDERDRIRGLDTRTDSGPKRGGIYSLALAARPEAGHLCALSSA